jgi:hypothetical protein
MSVSGVNIEGCLFITQTRLLFAANTSLREAPQLSSRLLGTELTVNDFSTAIPLGLVQTVEVQTQQSVNRQHVNMCVLTCRDFRNVSFAFHTGKSADNQYAAFIVATRVEQTIRTGRVQLAQQNYDRLLASASDRELEDTSSIEAGFDLGREGFPIFDFAAEFARQQVPAEKWRCSDANFDYKWSPTYPARLYFPVSLDEKVRLTNARFPCLSSLRELFM